MGEFDVVTQTPPWAARDSGASRLVAATVAGMAPRSPWAKQLVREHTCGGSDWTPKGQRKLQLPASCDPVTAESNLMPARETKPLKRKRRKSFSDDADRPDRNGDGASCVDDAVIMGRSRRLRRLRNGCRVTGEHDAAAVMRRSSGKSRRRSAAVSPAETPALQSGRCCYTRQERMDVDGSEKSSRSLSTRQPAASCPEGRAALPELHYHSSRGTASASSSISPRPSWAAYFHAKLSQGLPQLPSPLPLSLAELLETRQSVNQGGECGVVGRGTAVEAASAGATLDQPFENS
ncbi:unnamed protein product [Closterium sp. NIES-64]|nr:unnamed protein product [Closterium sp. NIES-64]